MSPVDQAIAALAKLAPAVDGENGSGQCFGAACCCVHDFGLGEADAMDALRQWNATCRPPWKESELLHKVRDALQKSPKNGKARGWRLRRGGIRYCLGSGTPPTAHQPSAPGPAKAGRLYDLDEDAELPDPMPDGTRKLLAAAFNPGEFIGIAREIIRPGDTKGTPEDGGVTLTREAWLEKLSKYDGDPNRFLSTADKKTGAYIRINPMRDRGTKDGDVTDYRHALLEFDALSLGEQMGLIVHSHLPCTAVLSSGGRSIHAWVRVDAKTLEEYRDAVDFIYAHFAHYKPDIKNKNPSRFSRLPGMVRGEKRQELLCLRIGLPSFAEWKQQKEEEGIPAAEPWLDFAPVPEDDPSVLIGPGRWLTRGNGVILNGPTGIGKSTLVASLCFAWALGRPALGFRPLKPLKILIIQAEDDPGDLAEMKDGALHSLGDLTEVDREMLRKHVRIVTERALTGSRFLHEFLRPAARRDRPDMIVLNPLSAYFGADLNKQEIVAAFFRNTLNPILTEFQCAILVIHHTPKPTKERKGLQAGELAYSGSGSADLANWARESLDLRPIKGGLVELTVTKRWRRLGWLGSDGKLVASRILAYGLGGKLYWREATELEVKGISTAASEEAVVALVPDAGIDRKNLMSLAATEFDTSEKTISRRIKEALEKKWRTVNGVKLETALLTKAVRQYSEVYPESTQKQHKPVVWLTRVHSITTRKDENDPW